MLAKHSKYEENCFLNFDFASDIWQSTRSETTTVIQQGKNVIQHYIAKCF